MKNLPLILVISFIFTCSTQNISAQSVKDSAQRKRITQVIIQHDSIMVDKDDLKEIKKTRVETGLSYQNNDVYLGRKDSTVLPYYIPFLSYYHKSGLYFSVHLNYLKNTEASRVDLVTMEAGYVFGSGNYDGQVNVSKFFYNSQSTSVSSEIQAGFEYQNGYDFGFIKPNLDINLNFGNKIDYTGSFSLEHGFTALHKKLEFTPTLTVNGGTQNFYDSYYKNKRYSNNKNNKNIQNGVSTITGSVVNPSSFKILDYEASMPFSYTIKNLVINFTPTYSIPLNPALINIHTGQSNGTSSNQVISENLTNTIYWTIGITFRLG
jgi:hypothetical protein